MGKLAIEFKDAASSFFANIRGSRKLQEEEVFEVSEATDEDDYLLFLGETCETDAGCGTSGFLICPEMLCKHKPVFPLVPIEITGTVVLTILMALAVMSGIGGGGIIVSLLMVFYQLDTKAAIAVSGFTILTGSLARYIITINARHPHKDAPVIDYGIANVMLPTVLIGSLVGVFLNIILPALILQICLTLLLVVLSINSGFKAMEIYTKESLEKKNELNDPELPPHIEM